MDDAFVRTAREHFNPYRASSGTEHVACLLYALARMTRPRVVVEYGSGYSTLWILRALAENAEDIRQERDLLREKSLLFVEKARSHVWLDEHGKAAWDVAAKEAYREWFCAEGKACALDPGYHCAPYEPRLYCFDELGADHAYLQTLTSAVRATGHESLFVLCPGQQLARDALPPDARTIDWAWNDHRRYREFFSEVWPALNPEGGLMIFHNVPARTRCIEDIAWMKAQRAEAGDLEVLLLEEPHKLNQNGCAILRKTSEYKPRCERSGPVPIWQSTLAFLGQSELAPVAGTPHGT